MKNICIISSIGFFTLGSISSYLFSKLKTKIVGIKKLRPKQNVLMHGVMIGKIEIKKQILIQDMMMKNIKNIIIIIMIMMIIMKKIY